MTTPRMSPMTTCSHSPISYHPSILLSSIPFVETLSRSEDSSARHHSHDRMEKRNGKKPMEASDSPRSPRNRLDTAPATGIGRSEIKHLSYSLPPQQEPEPPPSNNLIISCSWNEQKKLSGHTIAFPNSNHIQINSNPGLIRYLT